MPTRGLSWYSCVLTGAFADIVMWREVVRCVSLKLDRRPVWGTSETNSFRVMGARGPMSPLTFLTNIKYVSKMYVQYSLSTCNTSKFSLLITRHKTCGSKSMIYHRD